MKKLAALCAFALLPGASAQLQFTLQPPPQPIYESESTAFVLSAKNGGQHTEAFSIAPECLSFNLYYASGAEVPQRQRPCPAATAKGYTIAPQQTQQVTLWLPYDAVPKPGNYRFVVYPTVPQGAKASASFTALAVPMRANLFLAGPAKAGQPLPLKVAFRNVSPRPNRPSLCKLGLLIRNVNGRTVYDNKAERLGCKTGMPLWSIAPNETYTAQAIFGSLALPTGSYTAILWGEYSDTLRFTVK